MDRQRGALATNRFGMGARPGEIDAASSDPRGWLLAQIRPEAALLPAGELKSSRQVLNERAAAYAGRPRPMDMPAPGAMPSGPPSVAPTPEQAKAVRDMVQRETRDGLNLEIDARTQHSAQTTTSFAERWTRFWSNHFTVAARNPQMIGLVGPFEREAIRPNAFGSFSALLGAATFHPAMLIYLDANRSIGPSTQIAKRRDAGLNENLAREILELHTLGVSSGYTQQDIVELAKALTGWTAGQGPGQGGGQGQARMGAAQSGQTLFVEALHEPGARTLLARTYDGAAEKQAKAMLDDIAAHPATARHLATKLARHFVADEPPPAAISRLESAFTAGRGDLSALARAVVELDEAWLPEARKFKTPEELVVSVSRAAGHDGAFGRDQMRVYQSLGQQPFRAPSPAGWADTAATWSGADAIRKRLDWANAVSRRLPRGGTPSGLLESSLGPLAGERTRLAVSRAESVEQGVTLAIMSPEFQRR